VPRDATAGRGPGILPSRIGRLGVVISYEVFFADRARAAARAGGRVLLVPTNASSFTTSQVPGQELAAARLRAIETGRSTVQSAPTGYTAVIDHAGHVMRRSALGRPAVVPASVTLRSGSTPATALGPWPFVLLAVAILALGRLD
jgi:apolipoprotein N-acyltransferase